MKRRVVNETGKEVLKTTGTSVLGGACGAGLYALIGGVGVTAVGTGIGITLGPFIAIGAGIGGAGYGLVWLGKQIGRKKRTNASSPNPEAPVIVSFSYDELMRRVVYIRDLYSAMNIPLKRDQGLSLALDRAEAVAKSTLSADAVEGDGLHRTVRDTHVVWALSDSLATCVSAGLNVRPHLSQINTGSTDFGTPASGSSKEIFFKDFEAELLVAAALLRGGLPVKFFEDPNDPRGDMLVGNIVLEVKHPNSIGQLEKLLSKFHGQLREHDDRGIFVVALEDAFAMSSIDFSDQSEYDTWKELRDAQIEGFGRPFLDRVFRKARIGALVPRGSAKSGHLGSRQKRPL
jgi:hypothetical protein